MELRENKRRQCAFMCIYVHLCAFMCIYVHLHPTVSVEGLAVWFPDRPGIEEIKWNQKEIRITAASFSTHTCTALLSPDGNTHLHTFFDLLSLNLDVWFSFRLWGFFLSGSHLASDRQMEPEATRGPFKCSEAVLDKPEAAAGRHD